MVWHLDQIERVESAKIKHMIPPYTRGRVLDLGCGDGKAWPRFTGVDSGKEWGKAAADFLHDCEKLPLFSDASWDAVFSSHLLEHIVDYKAALREWWRLIKVGGSLVLYLPHKDLYPNIGQEGANKDHKHDFLPEDIITAMRDVAPSWRLVENETRSGRDEYSMFLVFNKTEDGQQIEAPWRHPGGKTCLVIRYGAFGDQIIASSILPLLKRQGYHVTYQCTPRGHDVLRHDPNIDTFWVQDTNYVPNGDLGTYWEALREEGRWDKVINLCESIEGTLLKIAPRLDFFYSDEARRAVVGKVNYLERTHDIAGVPHEFAPQFFATLPEIGKAKAERDRMGPLCVLWVPIGSSQHKMWPFVDIAVTWLLKHSPAHVVMCGDESCKSLEQTVEKTLQQNGADVSRFHPRSGKWSIRETMTFANMATVVVGPETGVLNAVCMHPKVGKVVMLSHSSADNLTKHWRNTVAIEPTSPCYPCHRMHYDLEHCPQDEKNKAAACASSIEPRTVFEAIMRAAGIEKRQAAE